MIEIIGIIGMMVLVCMTKMTKEELAEWFAETTGTTNPQNAISHVRCQAGKWMRVTTDKWTFCTLGDLMTEGFGIPAYFMNRDGWEAKKVLLSRCAETKQWELISAGAIRDLEGKLRQYLFDSDYSMFTRERDGSLLWWGPDEAFVKDDKQIESLQFTFDREKKGHDGTENTAPYRLSKKNPIVTNEIPA